MKKLSCIILILLVYWGCSENMAKSRIIYTQKTRQNEKSNSTNNKKIKNIPCIEIQEFVVDIEKMNWISDTIRLNKVVDYSELNQKKIKYFNYKPFYPICFKDSKLSRAYNSKLGEDYLNSLDYELFKSVNNIWGYFYRKGNETDVIPDGVIEQWEFETEIKADTALHQISEVGSIVYFNTNPYFCRIGNKLIIFQTRAMAFSYDQKLVYENFINKKRFDEVSKK